MKENENEKNEDIIMIIIFSILFFIIYIIYLSIIIKYITNNYHRKKLCVFWIDYCILNFAAIIFMIIYVIYVIVLLINKTKRIDNITCLKKRIFPITIIISLAMLVYTIINSLIFDAITAFQLSFKMNKIKKIEEKEDDFFSLAEKFKNINVHKL
jgi:hypothetical protein